MSTPKRTNTDEPEAISSPHGPHPDTIDEVAGGADSSPDETMSSDERADANRKKKVAMAKGR